MSLKLAKKIFLFVFAGFFIFLPFSSAGTQSLAEPGIKEPPRAMWVWDVKIFQDAKASRHLFDFCEERDINTLFYTAYQVKGSAAGDYRRFNKSAHQRGIFVHALAGDPRWGFERYHHRFLLWVNDILEFNKASAENERFDAIHSDVEPHTMGKRWEDDRKGILAQYLDVSEKVKKAVAESDCPTAFVMDVPFWYDDDVSLWLEWRHKMSPASYHLLDIADKIVIMDYRNFAEGQNGSILLVKNEIAYADRIGKKIYIGQETGRNLTPAYISFANTSVDYMEKEIKKLVTEYIAHPSFSGIAIHYYMSYREFLSET